MKYSGIDLHSNNVVAVIDDQDHVLYRKRLANDLQQIIAAPALIAMCCKGWSWNQRFMDASGTSRRACSAGSRWLRSCRPHIR